jgi:hypothetical protein
MIILIQMGPILGLDRLFSIKIKQDNYEVFHPIISLELYKIISSVLII